MQNILNFVFWSFSIVSYFGFRILDFIDMNNLYIVSTPIGNLQDITIRAIKILQQVDYILTENPQKTGTLLSEIKKRYPELCDENKHPKILHFNEYIENEKAYEFMNLLEKGYNVALVSEAGTPLISDPGYKLVHFALSKGIKLISVPGASAVAAALVCSGLPTDKYFFLGFLPKTKLKKEKHLSNLKSSLEDLSRNGLNPTVIFFESPHRVLETLYVLKNVFGNIRISLGRELTKVFEENVSDNLSNLIAKFETSNPKGEFTVLFNLKSESHVR